MRKHNKRFAQRWARSQGDRSNFPQTMAHKFVHDKAGQFNVNPLLSKLFKRIGIDVDAMYMARMERKLAKLDKLSQLEAAQ